ncbi:MAG: MATE family efflux transporter, partial [Eubacteriales bacterium]|nr:MATE family efflux transporter [Eubacteriales bacterium]
MAERFSQNTERQRVIQIAWPVLVELLLSSLFSMIDMMMLGNIPIKELANQSVAAVGIVNQPLFIGISLVQSLNVGGTAIIARYMGSGQRSRIESVLKHVLLLSFVGLAIPFFILFMFLAPNIMQLLGAEPGVIRVGAPYFRIILIGFLF